MPPSVFNPLHYDNATYVFLLALHAGVEPVQLSCDTATYSLPVVHLDRARVEQMPQSVFDCTTTTRRTFSFSRFMRALNP